MQHVGQPMRYSDLEHLPPDGSRRELFDGALLSVPPPSAEHDAVVARLEAVLVEHSRRHGGQVVHGPVPLVLSPHDVVLPDLVFFHASRSSLIHDIPPIRHAPDLIAEVLASNTAAIDRGPKMRLFARRGVLEYWLVDPENASVEVHILRDGHYELFQQAFGRDSVRSTILPDLTLVVATIFP